MLGEGSQGRSKGWLELGDLGTFDTELHLPGPCLHQTLGARPLVVGWGSEATLHGHMRLVSPKSQVAPLCVLLLPFSWVS